METEGCKELLRIVRDDRVYRLDDHFFVSPLLVYEFGDQEITVECKHIFTSNRPTPRVVAGAGQIEQHAWDSQTTLWVRSGASELDVEALQASFQSVHQWHQDVCYACVRYQCTMTSVCHGTCCNYCLKTDRGRAQSEEDVHDAWLFSRDLSTQDLPSMLPTVCHLAVLEDGDWLRQSSMA